MDESEKETEAVNPIISLYRKGNPGSERRFTLPKVQKQGNDSLWVQCQTCVASSIAVVLSLG